MEFLYVIGLYIAFFTALAVIVWFVGVIGKFLETRKYKKKLRKLTPQLAAINMEELFSKLSDVKESYSTLMELLQERYKLSGEDEQVKTIEQYVQEEANYRRSKRRKPLKSHRRKYGRRRRWY